jgi:signal transduction histidine kinase
MPSCSTVRCEDPAIGWWWAGEEERRRPRRDLHDGLGPALAGVV